MGSPQRFGPFYLLKSLGAGGMGTAHLAAHPGTEALLVVKRMHPGMMREPTLFKRFVHEAEVASHVRHANVAALVAMGAVDGEPFLATEFVFGIQLSQIVERIQNASVEPVPLQVALLIGIELASGLVAIHQARHRTTGGPLGLVHRDVGTRNVLVGFDGQVRLIDLGLGKSILADWQTSADVLAGSPDYMPPEQALGGRVDARADVYAAAVSMWELLAGKKRIREDNIPDRIRRAVDAQPERLRDHRPNASPSLEQLLQLGMAPDPEHRLSSAADLRDGLDREVRRLRPAKPTAVRDWLDSACATIIARERRALRELRARLPEWVSTASHVEFFVDDLEDWASLRPDSRPPEGRVATPRGGQGSAWSVLALIAHPFQRGRRTSLVAVLTGFSIFVGVVCVAAGITVWMLLPSRALVVVDSTPVAPSSPSIPVPDPYPSAPMAPAATPPPAPPRKPDPVRLSDTEQVQKNALLRRLKALRKRKYDVAWQRRVTGLSVRLSRARNQRDLTQIEADLIRLEKAR